MQEFVVRWNVAHRRAVMDIAHITFFIDDATQRHTTEFKQVDFLSIQFGDGMVGVGQTDKRDALVRPIASEFGLGIRTYSENLNATRNKFGIAIT